MKRLILVISAFLLLGNIAFAEKVLFTKDDCSFCKSLQQQLNSKDYYQIHEITEYEISLNPENQTLFLEKSKEVGYKAGAVPLLIDGQEYFEGEADIINHLEAISPAVVSKISAEDSKEINNILQEESQKKGTTQKPAVTPKSGLIVLGIILFLAIIKLSKTNRQN